MELRDQENRTNHWLDSALKGYGEVEPRPDLEGRVLVNLRSEKEKSRDPGWWRAVAVVVGLFAVAFFVVNKHSGEYWKPAEVRKPPVNQSQVSSIADSASREAVVSLRLRKAKSRVSGQSNPRIRHAEPRLEQFPSPQPLSAQDKLLLHYLRKTPREEMLMTATHEQSFNDLNLEDITVPSMKTQVDLPTLDLKVEQVSAASPDVQAGFPTPVIQN